MAPKAMIIWNKVNPAQHLDKYFKQHEIIFYYGKFGGEKTVRRYMGVQAPTKHLTPYNEKYASVIRRYVENTGDAENVYCIRNGQKSSIRRCC